MYAQTPDAARRMTIFIIFTVVFPTPMSAATPESASSITKVIIAEAATPITILNQILFLKSDILFYRSRIKVCTQPSYYALSMFLPAQSYIRPTAKDFACAKVNTKNEKHVKKAAESTNNRLIGRLLYILSFNASRGLQRFDADKICVTALAVGRSACYNDLISAF